MEFQDLLDLWLCYWYCGAAMHSAMSVLAQATLDYYDTRCHPVSLLMRMLLLLCASIT
jgi:hypothetical protein